MSPNNSRIKIWLPLIIAATFGAGIWIGHRLFSSPSGDGSTTHKLNTILNLISHEYVDDVDTDSLIEVSIPDIMAKLDPHTVYIPAADLQNVNDELKGSFGGIGVSFTMMADTITVLEVISGGPSEKVGLLAGDRIVTIDDTVATNRGWSMENVQKRLKGEKGTVVRLGIMRNTSPDVLPFEVTRGDIPVTSIDASYIIEPGIGFLKVNKFGRNTYAEFLTELVSLKAQGAEKIILDLRGNGGGLMDMAVLMANEFLPAGRPIVAMHGRTDASEQSTFSDGTGAFQDVEVVILLDEFSASSSEILAGALQDNDRALIVGRRSFGKGLVQNQIELPDSSAIRLTTARYYTPSGRCIQKAFAGKGKNYDLEILERYNNGEAFSLDSVKLDKSQIFYTGTGREVYGGGGIMPDVFVPNDTSGITSYYINVANAGLMQKFAFEYTDHNRAELSKAKSVDELLGMLPPDDVLLQDFVNYARNTANIPPRWYYINISRNLIVTNLKALIVRDLINMSASYEVLNKMDTAVKQAIEELNNGNASFPIEGNANH